VLKKIGLDPCQILMHVLVQETFTSHGIEMCSVWRKKLLSAQEEIAPENMSYVQVSSASRLVQFSCSISFLCVRDISQLTPDFFFIIFGMLS